MKVTKSEKAIYDKFLAMGIDGKAIAFFILKARTCAMYAQIFYIAGLDPKLKNLLSKIYKNKIEIEIAGKDARQLISETFSL